MTLFLKITLGTVVFITCLIIIGLLTTFTSDISSYYNHSYAIKTDFGWAYDAPISDPNLPDILVGCQAINRYYVGFPFVYKISSCGESGFNTIALLLDIAIGISITFVFAMSCWFFYSLFKKFQNNS